MKYNNAMKYDFLKVDYRRRKKLFENPKLSLPNADKVFVDDRKFTHYLFGGVHQGGLAKGDAFKSRLGYSISNWQLLKDELLLNVARYPAKLYFQDEYGDRYTQKMILYGLKNKPANVVVGWAIKDGKTRLTTMIIKEMKR